MTGRDVALALLALALIAIGLTLAIATADIPPCWPECAS